MNIMFIFIVNALHISDVLDECDFVHRTRMYAHAAELKKRMKIVFKHEANQF